jgi:UDP-sulfoquinovose synthase
VKVLVLGGDGFCGWPCAVNLADVGHDVVIVDNLSRRKIDIDLGVESLTPIAGIRERLTAWEQVGGRPIRFAHLDIAKNYEQLLELLRQERPEAVVHFAEQRAAPYSMKSSATKRYTVDNNVNGTHNLLAAIVESGQDIHIVHLGTMGVYGYGSHRGATIPEGYLTVEVPQPDGSRFTEKILHPANPGSVYHMTKTLDQLLFFYYNKNDNIRITDLHQGIVWGTIPAASVLSWQCQSPIFISKMLPITAGWFPKAPMHWPSSSRPSRRGMPPGLGQSAVPAGLPNRSGVRR